VALSVGNNFYSSYHNYFGLAAEDNQTFLPVLDNRLRVNLQAKVIYWIYDDSYYTFHAIALNPGSGFAFSLNENFIVDAAIGPVFNIQLKSDRKNNEAVGWPQQVDINYMVRCIYHF
jgi:hypothetical protein